MYRKLTLLLLALLAVFPALAQQSANVRIDWPPPVYDVAGTINVVGTVNPPGLQSYFLEAAEYRADTPLWLPVSLPSNTPVDNGVLAQWLTTILPDGIYTLRLHAVLASGENLFYEVGPLRVANQLERPESEIVPVPPSVPPPTQAPTVPPPEPTVEPPPAVVNQLPVPVGGQVTYFNDRTIAAMRIAGMTWVKWQIPYQVGSDTSAFRDRINWSHEAGFNVLLSITGDKDQLGAMGDEYYPAFAQFLGQVAALGPDAIEVWNEMNLDREWPRGRISPRTYVQKMLQPAYAAIKAANPDVMVITGAPAPTGFYGGCTGNGCDDGDFYWGMANAGAPSYADCIGVHYNEGILSPRQRGGDPRDTYPTRYFPLMTDRASEPFRGSDIPLCYTELGYLSPEGYGPLPPNFAWAGNTSVAEQAEWLHDAIQIAAGYTARRIALIIVFNVDFDRYEGGDPQAGYAIIRPDGSCPACQTIGSLRRQ